MSNIEPRTIEARTWPRRRTVAVAVAAGVLAIGGCSGSEGANTAEKTPGITHFTPNTAPAPTAEPSDEFTPESRNSWEASDHVIHGILKRACVIAKDQERKQYPNLWNNGLTELSDEFDAAYHNKVSPDLFDDELAEFCPAYARLTDHGAG